MSKIWCNGQLLKEGSYCNDAGDIVGLRYCFLGAGKVYDIKMTDEKQKIAYSDSFN